MKSQKQDNKLFAYKPGAKGRSMKSPNKPNKKVTTYNGKPTVKPSQDATVTSAHEARQTRFLDSLTTMPEEYVVQKDSAGRPFIIKEVKLANIHKPPEPNSSREYRSNKAYLIEHFFNGLVVPVNPSEVIRMINHERGLIFDTSGKNAFMMMCLDNGNWVKTIHDGAKLLYSNTTFAKVEAHPDGTYSVEDTLAVIKTCWNGHSISYLKARNDWQKLFNQAGPPRSGQFGNNPAQQFASIKLENGSNLMRVRYDKRTGMPKSIKYKDGEEWSTNDGITWVISGSDGHPHTELPDAYLTIDQNGNVSHYMRSANGTLFCRIITPCGKCIKAPRRLDTEALMRGNK